MTISRKVPRVKLRIQSFPSSLRELIEDAVRKDRTFDKLIESPIATLKSYGVAFDERTISEKELFRFIKVIGNLRHFIDKFDIDKHFHFEEVFQVGEERMFGVKESETYAVSDTKWDRSDPSVDVDKGTNEGVNKNFDKDGHWLDGKEQSIFAPLLSPSDLTEICVRIEETIRNQLEE